MSTSRRRSRRRRDHETGPAAAAAPAAPAAPGPGGRSPSLPPLPAWHWRTFPVYFALSFGLFAGVYLGAAGVWLDYEGNGTFLVVVQVIAAIFFGFALSRIAVRWMVSRNLVKPRTARKR